MGFFSKLSEHSKASPELRAKLNRALETSGARAGNVVAGTRSVARSRFGGSEGYYQDRYERQATARAASENQEMEDIFEARARRAGESSMAYKESLKELKKAHRDKDEMGVDVDDSSEVSIKIRNEQYLKQKEARENLLKNMKSDEAARREKDIRAVEDEKFTYLQRQKEQRERKSYEVDKEVEKARRIDREKLNIRIIDAKIKREEAFAKEYGPAFNLPIVGQAVGRTAQYRNYQQAQELKRLKQSGAIGYQQNINLIQNERARILRQQDPRASGGFGNPLSLGGGFGMGMGMNVGPSQQQPLYGAGQAQDSYVQRSPFGMGGLGQPQSQETNPFGMNGGMGAGSGGGIGMSSPFGVGGNGMGGGINLSDGLKMQNPFGMSGFGSEPRRQEVTQQPQQVRQIVQQPQQVQRVQQLPDQSSRGYGPSQRPGYGRGVAPVGKPQYKANVGPAYNDSNSSDLGYRKVIDSYGPRYLKIRSPSEIAEGESIYNRVISRRGNRVFVLRR